MVWHVFEDINLAATSGNPPVGGHGNVLFKIKSKNDLVVGDSVSKTANIFFDYNAPINTDPTETIFQALSNTVFNLDESIVLYPNPVNSIININCKNSIKTIELYDVQGRILQTILENDNTSTIDITNKSNGIYFVKITTEIGSKVEKVVKE
ncbi:T9SS type A sorting domain-containing protein [Flavobacterium sp.]|uniref:T9SS type A sorting domain-containing protein n=1 Tax=Flavobacterium sp. TaxID=239 RepID=UPI0037528CA5